MGAWRMGNFENDEAADFVAQLTASRSPTLLRTIIEEVLSKDGESNAPMIPEHLVGPAGIEPATNGL